MSQRNLISTPRQEMPAIAGGVLQRKCACGRHTGGGQCGECRKKRSLETLPAVEETLRSSGEPLAAGVRGFMERRIGHDFSRVRIHTGEAAAGSARAVDALAYTVGSDVVFGAGQYAPETPAGRRLIAHELTHVVQQGGRSAELRGFGSGGDLAEREADSVARAVEEGGPSIPRSSAAPGGLQRAPAKEGPPGAVDQSLLRGESLPYREATELLKCVQIMGKDSEAYCRQQVLGEQVDDSASTAAAPEADETAKETGAQPERKVTVQPPAQTITSEELDKAAGKKEGSEPWKLTPKAGAEGETSRQLKTGSRENVQSAVVSVEAEKEGAGSVGATVKSEHAKESAPGKEPESSASTEYAIEGKIPVGSWIFDEKKLKHWVLLKEIGLQGSLATKRTLGPDPRALRILAGELTVGLIGYELKSRKVDFGLGLSTILKLQGTKGAEGWKKETELGGEAGADFKWRPTGGALFVFIEATTKLTTTKEEGGKFQPGVFNFTLLGGLGWQIPLSRKRAPRR